jgi:diguanylate cyclase (GGDEF)-like protein
VHRPAGFAKAGNVLAVLVVLVGGSGAVLAANVVAHNDAGRSADAFDATASEIASTLQLALQHEADLVADTAAFLISNPGASNADFVRWTQTALVSQRYPELQSIGELAFVTAAELPAFVSRTVADPSQPLGPGHTYTVSPPGQRPFYCLGGVSTSNPALALPAGLDICATTLRSLALSARDSGVGAFIPYQVGKQTLLAIETPIYSSGIVPATVQGRQATFIGWVGTLINPTVVLDRALQTHPGRAVTIRYHAGSTNVEFSAGSAPPAAHAAVIDLHNGYTVTTHGALPAQGVVADRTALGVLLAGTVLSALLGLLIFVLVTARARAMRTVRQKTQELRYQALHDALTGLPNRALVLDRVEQGLARARRNQGSLAVMFLDLDGFKDTNDTFGHSAGDELLRSVAGRLSGLMRDSDTVGRFGGDEFVVVVEADSLAAGPDVIAERIRDALAVPFTLPVPGAPTVQAQVSIGIAVGVRASAEELLRDADIALYEAKREGRDRYVVFAPEMKTAVQGRLELAADLRAAIGSDQFFLVYQPIFGLESTTLTGVEALIRWHHPTRGLVMPDEFIPLAEDTALIVPIGHWVLHEACRQAAEWRLRGHPIGVSVNMSGRQLDDDVDFLADVRDALTESGLPAGLLTLEITETMLMRDAPASARRLGALKALGVRIAIDDFGTGYSSLGYLQQFPVDALKIDRSFINGMSRNPESAALIHTMIELGRSFGIETLAEGIEDRAQLLGLLSEQCDSGQGFLFARPLSPDALEELIGLSPRMPVAT